MARRLKTMSVPSGAQFFTDYRDMPLELAARLESLAYRHGRYFDSYIVTEPNRQYFWSAGKDAVIGCTLVGRYMNIAGGMICSPERRSDFAEELVEFARLNRLTLSFFMLDQDDAELLNAHGFQTTKFGEEATVELRELSWSGKKMEWGRRQVNYVRRHNVEFEELDLADQSSGSFETSLQELIDLESSHLATKVQKGRIPFFEGSLIPGYLHRRRIFVGRRTMEGGGQRVEGFVVCNPFENGHGWAIEMYRHRPDAVRGTIPFLFHQTISQLKDEGAQYVSLSPVPALRCETPLPDDSPLVRRILSFWYNHWNFVFDVPGIFHFKSRFRPRFSDVHVCVYPKATISSVLAYASCSNTFDIKYTALARVTLHRLRRRGKLSQATPVSDNSRPRSRTRDS